MYNDVMSNFGHKKSFPDIKIECLDFVRENDALTGPTPGVCLKIDQDLISSCMTTRS